MMTKFFLLMLVSLSVYAQEQHWSYSIPNGPDQWGSMAGFSTCSAGSSQSPVALNFNNISFDSGLKTLVMNWGTAATKPFNNGHTIEVPYDNGGATNFQGEDYPIRQFHFHSPSEHTLNNKSYPLEIHFVHKTASNKILVVGVFVEEGQSNPELAEILSGDHVETISAEDLLPTDTNYLHYMGSLTTPPCSENVSWIVLKEPIQASKHELNLLQKINRGPNNRPLQSINNRSIGSMEI
jgi:carbonic anhydrase